MLLLEAATGVAAVGVADILAASAVDSAAGSADMDRGIGFGYYPYYYGGYYGPGCVWVRRLVPTPYGLRWRLVPVCY